MSVPSEGDRIVKNRSKIYLETFLSSDEEEMGEDLDMIGNKKLEDNQFIKIIRRRNGMRINYNMIHPRDHTKKSLFKFYLSNAEYERMSDLVKSHRDILIFIDGSSRGNPGRAGAGIGFFGRKIQRMDPQIEETVDIIDISDNSPSDNIFDILANEKKREIFRESQQRIKTQSRVKTIEDELEEREFMFGA